MRVANKRVTATKNVPLRAILTVCMILLVCDGCRLGQQELEGALTDLQLFSQVPIFTFAETYKPEEEGRLSSELGNLRGVSSNHYETEPSEMKC